jgi:hypothetical protein
VASPPDTVGHAVSLDVDLTLTTDDAADCMIRDCDAEAVVNGVISTPCGCGQELCLRHYEAELPMWIPGDTLWCYKCSPKTLENEGRFVRWEWLK